MTPTPRNERTRGGLYRMSTLHAELLRDVIGDDEPTDEGALLWMTLLHTHGLSLRVPVTMDHIRPAAKAVSGEWEVRRGLSITALTFRHVADILADVWPACDGEPRAAHDYYHAIVTSRYPQDARGFAPDFAAAIAPLRDRLAAHPAVQDVFPDDG